MGYIIKNKIDGIKLTKKLKLNTFPEDIFNSNETEKIKSFIRNNPAELYAIHSKTKTTYEHNDNKVKAKDILEKIKLFDTFVINISSFNYNKYQVFVGEGRIGSDNSVYLIGSKNPSFSGRQARQKPDYNLHTDIFDKKLNQINGFNDLYNYVIENNLEDVIIEFIVYSKPFGLYHKKVIIFELRTEF